MTVHGTLNKGCLHGQDQQRGQQQVQQQQGQQGQQQQQQGHQRQKQKYSSSSSSSCSSRGSNSCSNNINNNYTTASSPCTAMRNSKERIYCSGFAFLSSVHDKGIVADFMLRSLRLSSIDKEIRDSK